MSEKILRKWVQEGESTLCLNWEIQCFYFTSTIIWRGVTIGIKVQVNRTDSGHYKKITFQYNGRTITHDSYRWKNWGNENMDFVPFIKVDNYELKISVHTESLQLTDSSRTEIKWPWKNPVNLFTIINYQEYSEPVKPNQGEARPLLQTCRESITLYRSKYPKPSNLTTAYYENEELIISRHAYKHFVMTEHLLKLSKANVIKLIEVMGFTPESERMILKILKECIEGERLYEIIKHYMTKKEIKYVETTKRLWVG